MCRRDRRSPPETQQIYRENEINGDFSEIICKIKTKLKINLLLKLVNIFKNFYEEIMKQKDMDRKHSVFKDYFIYFLCD